jgi:hypothetical protein
MSNSTISPDPVMSENTLTPDNTNTTTQPSVSDSPTTTTSSDSDNDKMVAMSMPIFAGIAAGLILTIVVVIILFLVKGKSKPSKQKKTKNSGEENNLAEEPITPIEVEKIQTINNASQQKKSKRDEKEAAFGGKGNISVSFHPDHGGDQGDFYNQEIMNDKSSRGFLDRTDDTDRNGRKPYTKVVALFSQQLNKINQDVTKQMNIKEEIEHMKMTKRYVNHAFAEVLGNPPRDDLSSIKILDTEVSKRSDLSAAKLARKQSHIDMVVYTDGNREGPDDSFYNQKIDNLKEEIQHMEREKIEAKKEEAKLEYKLTIKQTKQLQQMRSFGHEEVDEMGMMYIDENAEYSPSKRKELLQVKDHAVMTDYSHPQNIEILKDKELLH